jgi:hypothetical protein
LKAFQNSAFAWTFGSLAGSVASLLELLEHAARATKIGT